MSRLTELRDNGVDVVPDSDQQIKLLVQHGVQTVTFPYGGLLDKTFNAALDALEPDLKLAWQNSQIRMNGLRYLAADRETLDSFVRILEFVNSKYAAPELKKALTQIKKQLAGKAPRVAKPKMQQINIAGIPVDLLRFDEKDQYDVRDLRYLQSVMEHGLKKLHDAFGVRAKFPHMVADFKSMPPAQASYYVGQNMLVWYAKGNSHDDLAAGIKTLAHEYGHFVLSNWLDQKTRQAWTDIVKQDQRDVPLRELGKLWHEGERLHHFIGRLRHDDPLMSLVLDYVTLYHFKGSHLPTREELLKSTKVLPLSKHPVTGYGHTNPEEAFCEAFGMYVAYGPNTVHPLVRRWMQLVLPESSVHAELLIQAADRIEAAAEDEPLPPVLTVYHVGHTKDLSLEHLGKGEGNNILGPGLYFSTAKEFALAYQKYTKTPHLTVAQIDTANLYDPQFGIPEAVREKVLTLSRGLKRNSQTMRYGRGAIGDITAHYGSKRANQLLVGAGVSGAYEHLPSGAVEIAVFDLSCLSDITTEPV